MHGFGLIVLSSILGGPALAHPIDNAIVKAKALEARGDYENGLAELVRVAALGEQDYTLRLLLGWFHFNVGEYEGAEENYRAAFELSEGGLDAQLGLAWSAFRQGKHEQAEQYFKQILAQEPQHAGALEGLALAQKGAKHPWLQPHVYLTGSWTTGGTERFGFGGLVGLQLKLGDFYGQVDYRFVGLGVVTTIESGHGRRLTRSTSTSITGTQHEGYFSIGYSTSRFGAFAHGGLVANQKTGLRGGLAPLVGLSGRLTVYVDIWAAASYTIYDDIEILSLYASCAVPLGDWLVLTPAITSQVFGGAGVVAGRLDLRFRWSKGSIFIGGKVGDELRPVYLDVPVTYNLAETIFGGAQGGVAIAISDSLTLVGSYEMHLIRDETRHPPAKSSMHLLTIGVITPFY